jgi:hypothetical protein
VHGGSSQVTALLWRSDVALVSVAALGLSVGCAAVHVGTDASSDVDARPVQDDAREFGTDAQAIVVDAAPDAVPDAREPDARQRCPDLLAAYRVVRSSDTCMSHATEVRFEALASQDCAFSVSSDSPLDVEGVLVWTGERFEGGLNFPDLGRRCTMDASAAGFVVSCGECTVDLVPAPSP